MELGWIDFSDKDRKRAIDVLHLLNEGAMDELGIGVVRDAFADYFFPGTSTIQTRAKYFFIVPYALRTACAKYPNGSVEQIKKEMELIEKKSAQCMKDNTETSKETTGIIGASDLPRKWVIRQPSTIYWNGIRTFGIMKVDKLSMVEAIKIEQAELKIGEQRGLENNNRPHNESTYTEGAENDKFGVTGNITLWDPLLDYRKNWMDNLNIELTIKEAQYLRERISNSANTQKSLLKFMLDNNIRMISNLDSSAKCVFETLSNAVMSNVSSEMADMLRLANLFNILVYSLHVRYNYQMGNEKAKVEWGEIPQMAEALKELDLSNMFHKLNITGKVQGFLTKAQRLLLEGEKDDYIALDKCILEREIDIKTRKRCKLLQKENNKDKWIGGTWLDYRLMSADRILTDIYNVEEGGKNA